MFERSLNPQDIIGLLSKLKAGTPDYPTDLMAARKAAFMKQAVALKIHGRGHSGKGGGDGGSAGSGGSGGSGALGGISTAQSILLQAVIGVWIIAAMLTAAYVFRNQIIDLLQDNHLISVEVTQVPAIDSTLPVPITPVTEISPTQATPTSILATATPGAPSSEPTAIGTVLPDGSSNIQNTPDDTQGNQGLHLGQTPGTPDTPNQEKTDPPGKPDNPKGK